MNKKLLLSFAGAAVIAVAGTQRASADIPMAYYATLDGKSGQALKTAVYNLVSNNVSMLSYGSGDQHTWWGFYVTDYQMDGSKRQVIDRYSNDIRYFGSRGSSVSGMNIEHSFPKSWWGGSTNNAYKDLYNLMPCEQKINSSKSNYGMGIVTNVKTTNGCTKVGTGNVDGSTKNLWEPADKWKGEFARGYMYMATAYQNFTWTGEGLTSLQQGAYPTLQPWAYELYMEWAKNDMPDQMEIDRNNAVSQIQGNRNPFVDFPNLMEYVWGDSINTPLDIKTTVKAGQITGGDTPQPDTEETIVNMDFTVKATTEECTVTGTSNIWKYDSKYGWKGSGFYSNACNTADADVETPFIDLTGYKEVRLSLDQAANKFNSGVPTDFFTVYVEPEGESRVSINDKLTWPKGNSWAFVESKDVDLSDFNGKKIKIVFNYTSTDESAGTWEIKTLKITGKKSSAVENIYIDVDIEETIEPEFYSIDGRRLDPETARGIVIIRRGNSVRKAIIR